MQHCPAQYCPPSGKGAPAPAAAAAAAAGAGAEESATRAEGWVPAVYTSSVWVYEWPASTTTTSGATSGDDGSLDSRSEVATAPRRARASHGELDWLDGLRVEGLLDETVARAARDELMAGDGDGAAVASRLLAVVRAYRAQEGARARANAARQVARLLAARGE